MCRTLLFFEVGWYPCVLFFLVSCAAFCCAGVFVCSEFSINHSASMEIDYNVWSR